MNERREGISVGQVEPLKRATGIRMHVYMYACTYVCAQGFGIKV